MEELIKECTSRYGKAKLILEANRYYIEAEQGIMDEIVTVPSVARAIHNREETDRLEKEGGCPQNQLMAGNAMDGEKIEF